MLKRAEKFFSKNYLLIAILSLASFLRLYRINELLGFWFDQGRDALVIWDLIHKGKFFLIGPTTGIEGVFRGPWYYWLIAPFYWIGNGDPLYPSVFLILTSILAILVLYKVGKELGGERVGLLSAFLASFSVYLIGISRWLSNPVPMLLIGISVIWAVFKFLNKKIWAVPLIGFLAGMALQFGSATEYFYIPVLLFIFIWKRKLLPNVRVVLLSLVLFGLAFAPQIFFELRHPGSLTTPLINFILHGKPSGLAITTLITSHLSYFYNLISSKFWVNGGAIFAPFFIIFVGFLLLKRRELIRDNKFIVSLIFSIAPFLGMLFFNGNSGNIYDYYFTGYFFIWFLLFSSIFIRISKSTAGKITLALFLVVFIYKNSLTYLHDYSVSLGSSEIIAFKNQLSAIDWIYKDANGRDFNVDEYVPPVIPYAYQYLFQWLGTTKYKRLPLEKNVPLLYTLYEVDPDHPRLINNWMDRQATIGKVITEKSFGGITAQERERIK